MPAIFKRQNTNWEGSLASDQVAITAVSANAAVLVGITQQFSVQFSQNISRIYDVSNGGRTGVVPIYYVGGRAEGTATIQRVIGPASNQLCHFYETFSDVCRPVDLAFTLGTGCGEESLGGVRFKLTGVLMQSMQLGVSSNDMIPNENVQLIFANMECENSGPVDPFG